MYNTIIIENFFDNFEYLENYFKRIPLMRQDEYPVTETSIVGENWPGQRSLPLQISQPFLTQLVIKEIYQKSDSKNLLQRSWEMDISCNLRLDQDNEGDYIHMDPYDLTMIVFLSKTNLSSGLNLYDNDKNEYVHIKYVQNRAIIFHSQRFHKSHLNFGNNIDNGRLTLNGFIKFNDG